MKNEKAVEQFKATKNLAKAVEEAAKAGVVIENGQVQFSNPLSRGRESLFVEGLPGAVRDIQQGLDDKAKKATVTAPPEPKKDTPKPKKGK